MKKSQNSVLMMTRAAAVAALYVVLTYISFLFGLASGPVQFRLSEALTVLPLFMPESVLGLALGCALSNLLTGSHIIDIIFGTLATLLGALGTRLLRHVKHFPPFLYTFPSILSNGIIVPLVLTFTIYGEFSHATFWPLVGSVSLGEAGVCLIVGTLLYYTLKRHETKLFPDLATKKRSDKLRPHT